jgi:hypothetical protein
MTPISITILILRWREAPSKDAQIALMLRGSPGSLSGVAPQHEGISE